MLRYQRSLESKYLDIVRLLVENGAIDSFEFLFSKEDWEQQGM